MKVSPRRFASPAEVFPRAQALERSVRMILIVIPSERVGSSAQIRAGRSSTDAAIRTLVGRIAAARQIEQATKALRVAALRQKGSGSTSTIRPGALAAHGESPAGIRPTCIPAGGVAPSSHMAR